MIVNHALSRGAVSRDSLGPEAFEAEARALRTAGLAGIPGGEGFVLALRSFDRFGDLQASAGDEGLDGGLPVHEEGERVRLEGKGRVLLEHCLDQRSRVCVSGFLEHELARAPAGRRLVMDFIAYLLGERGRRTEPEERELIDAMIDEGLERLLGLEPRPLDD